MLRLFRRSSAPQAANDSRPGHGDEAAQDAAALRDLVRGFSQQASELGREAAGVNGILDDGQRATARQIEVVQTVTQELDTVMRSNASVGDVTERSLRSVERARDAVEGVADEVGGIVDTLRQVASAAQQITQIALQTRLVAFNASVEAKRAGEAGRGFGVVADAVKDLAGKVEESSKEIMRTVSELDQRVDTLSREIRSDDNTQEVGTFHRALADVSAGVGDIAAACRDNGALCDGVTRRVQELARDAQALSDHMRSASQRSESFLKVSEHLIELIADCGIETEDTPYILAVQEAAAEVSALFTDAVRTGAIDMQRMFDERYQPIDGTDPQQYRTAFLPVCDELLPPVQERMLGLTPKVVFCVAADRNGFLPTHNRKYNNPQGRDPVWNTANCRNRRFFKDRTCLNSVTSERPFLLQTYRRDMGGGNFVLMKEASAPIHVDGRHWGGLRFAFQF